MKKALFFDLDGTLTESGVGVVNCVIPVLEYYGLPVPSRKELEVFVGPPLDETFLRFGVPEKEVTNAIARFRSRYLTLGKFENAPYPGIPELLEKLQSMGYPLYVATSKPESTAIEIMEKFDLIKYFTRVCGATMDGSRSHKKDVIAYLLNQIGTDTDAVMIGDPHYDVIGASVFGIDTIGVVWGYGKVEDMEKAGVKAIAHSMDELFKLLTEQ